MSKNKIIFLYPTQFLQKDYERFGVKYYLNNNVEIEIWNITPYLKKKYYLLTKNSNDLNFKLSQICHKIFSSKEEIIDSIRNEHKDTIFFVFINYDIRSRFIFTELDQSKLVWGFVEMSSYPISNIKIKDKLKLASINPMLIMQKFKNIYSNIIKKQNTPMPSFLILGGHHSASSQKSEINKKTKIIHTHQFNYDQYIELSKNKRVSDDIPLENYLAYIDEMVPHHLDNYHSGINMPNCNEEIYYQEINFLFKQIEKFTEKKIIILGYQKAKSLKINREKLFDGREIIYDKTNELIKYSDGVLMHNSTAVSFPVIYKKPIMFITSHNYVPTYNASIVSLAKELGQEATNITKLKNIRFNEEINLEKYDAFFKKFINSRNKDDQSKSYEIIYRELFL